MTTKQDLAETVAEEVETPAPRRVVRKKWTAAKPAPAETPAAEPAPAETPAAEDDQAEPSDETATGTDKAEAGTAVRGGPRKSWVWMVGAATVLVVLALAATTAIQWVSADRARESLAQLETDRALRLEVSRAAHSFGQTLLSYDYQDLQKTRTALTAMATGDFLATYDEAFGGAMAQVIVKLKAVSQANVREVYLADADEGSAHAIVVVDQQVKTSEAIRSVKDSHLKITLVKQQGVWKIQDVTVLGAAKEDQYNLDGSKPTDQKKK
ncbi:hypothetical protein [Nonomuraea sediminis]|uniref:hypothetical protein n=1 Tax=Nonomuraea sediminis TaxID=2835864 RepID=UPI001BDC4064|nr:hypothetical protein [Nonomuraea sediminis]